DVVFLPDDHPVFLRFSVRLSDHAFRIAWGNFVIRLHQYLDRNGDHILTVKEAQLGNWQQQLLSSPFNRSGPRVPNAQATPATLDPNKDDKVSFDELAAFLRSIGFGPFGILGGQKPDARTLALFGYLDLNHDGKLSSDELAGTDRFVQLLDSDEDELLTVVELKPFENPYANQFRGVQIDASVASADRGPFVPIIPGDPLKKLARRVLAKYDRIEKGHKDQKLSRDELGIAEEPFRKADTDGDGLLTLAELEGLLAHPPVDLALVISLTKGSAAKLALAPAGAGPSPRLAAKARKTSDGSLVIEIDGGFLTLGVNDNLQDLTDFYQNQFKNADADKNGYLDQKESQRNGFLNQVFATADRDGDGKLYEKELTAFRERQNDATESQATLSVSDRGRDLYEVIDANHDQRLSVRELRTTRDRLKTADRDADGLVGQNEVPRHYQLAIGRGQPQFSNGFMVESYNPGPTIPAGSQGQGLSWFYHMDRNGDGDVSLREFVGPRDVFLRLDADKDGLIDAKEAAQGP
ncbi:MAG TPA: hypothetical protein VGZ22_26035, partial [Isosphaeraceae bacterium]|nr:hypothetical protein [Isosphaeraceae bacterium]